MKEIELDKVEFINIGTWRRAQILCKPRIVLKYFTDTDIKNGDLVSPYKKLGVYLSTGIFSSILASKV